MRSSSDLILYLIQKYLPLDYKILLGSIPKSFFGSSVELIIEECLRNQKEEDLYNGNWLLIACDLTKYASLDVKEKVLQLVLSKGLYKDAEKLVSDIGRSLTKQEVLKLAEALKKCHKAFYDMGWIGEIDYIKKLAKKIGGEELKSAVSRLCRQRERLWQNIDVGI
jgi:hypothetical protein